MEVREYDGAYYRPVLRPGAWEPCTESDFIAACEGEDPWVDDPFAERIPDSQPIAMTEYGRAVDRVEGVDLQASEEALAACLRRAGDIVSIGGVIHRETAEPRYHVVVTGQRTETRSVRLAWRVDGLTSEEPQTALRNVHRGNLTDWSAGHLWQEFMVWDRHARVAEFTGLPPSAYDAALDVAKRVAELTGLKFAEGDVPGPSDEAGERDVAKAVLDALAKLPESGNTERLRAGPYVARVEEARRYLATPRGDPEGMADRLRSLSESISTVSVDPSAGPRLVDVDLYVATVKAMTGIAAEALLGKYAVDEVVGDEAYLAFGP